MSNLIKSLVITVTSAVTVMATNSLVCAVELAQGREVMSLTGQWRFQLDPQDVGEKQKWFQKDLPYIISLPGSTAEQGYGDNPAIDTKWTGRIIDKSWFADAKYEKYRKPDRIKLPFWLTPKKHYVGPAWYQKQFIIPQSWSGKRIVLLLERCHWQTKLWLDGKFIGSNNSLSTPHEYDLGILKPGSYRLSLCVDNTVKIDVGVNAHSVSDHTQTNWNGIIGRIELGATDPIWIDDLQIYPNVISRSAALRLNIKNTTKRPVEGTVTIQARSLNSDKQHTVAKKQIRFSAPSQTNILELEYDMGPDALLWDEFSPNLYQLTASISGENFFDTCTVEFGLREFGTAGTQFTINGRKTFLRGTLECCIFPLTGYPPTDVESWLRILKVAKAHGLNHLRFHSWCPPEAAFQAADRLGFYFQVEGPFWTRIGNGGAVDKFIYAECDRILKEYGNHPSFCLMAYGNEPGGRKQRPFLGDLVNHWRQQDPRHLYTSASGWPIITESGYHSSPTPRGHQWGAGLKSRFNAEPLSTNTDYRDFIARFSVPVVSHEIGQWCVYPNFGEIKKYKGILRATNFEIFRDSLAEHHMLDQAQDFLMASGKLQAILYKEEIETALRTPGFGGFQLLDLHDFPGQGTALVGVLDPFWDSKGYITAKEYHLFCCETVPLLRMDKCVWTTDEVFTADAEIAHFGPASIEEADIVWSITREDGTQIAYGQFPTRTIPIGNGTALGKIRASLTDAAAAAKLVVKVSLPGTEYSNHWDIWVYPANLDTSPPKELLIADSLDEEVSTALRDGRKVLLMPSLNSIASDIPAGFTTIFWNTQWTRKQPPHTLGILCDPKHPALAKFPTDFHSNWQWWDLVTKSRFMVLDDLPPELRPIVQIIDDWNTNRKLGLVFEAKVDNGKLLVCSIDLRSNLGRRPVARQLLHSLLAYLGSDRFSPKIQCDFTALKKLFKTPAR